MSDSACQCNKQCHRARLNISTRSGESSPVCVRPATALAYRKRPVLSSTPYIGEANPPLPEIIIPPTTWIPSDESGLVAWYKADVGLTMGGPSVTGWADQSGNNRHLSGTPGKYPTITANALNGLPAVTFASYTSSYLATAPFSLPQPFTIYALLRLRTYTQYRRLFGGITDGQAYCSNTVSPNISMRTGGSIGPTWTTWPTDTYAVIYSHWNGNLSKLWRDRQLTLGGIPGTADFGGLALGNAIAPYLFGSNVSIVEFIARSGADTVLQQTRHNTYLQQRGGTGFLNLVAEGDSITQGAGLSESNLYPVKFTTAKAPALWGYTNVAVGGSTIAGAVSRSVITDSCFDSRVSDNWLTAMLGHNDLAGGATVGNTYSALVAFCQARRATGWKVGVCTVLPSTKVGFNPNRSALNLLILANWPTFADALIDTAADPLIGPDAAASDPTYYLDGTHLTAAGQTRYATVVTAALP